MKEHLVRGKSWNLMVHLFKEAKKDGTIDFHEGRILEATDLNVTGLVNAVQKAWNDGRLTEDEKREIIFLIKKFEDDAVSLAEYDEMITTEEENMLEIIRTIIEEIFTDH